MTIPDCGAENNGSNNAALASRTRASSTDVSAITSAASDAPSSSCLLIISARRAIAAETPESLTVATFKPCFSALHRARPFPSSERGPVLFKALA